MKWIIGIDEVGRGPLAGPVVVSALVLPERFQLPDIVPIRDSKQLSEKQREWWFEFVRKEKILYAVARVTPSVIDRINISQAANRAARKALERVRLLIPETVNVQIILDAGLKVGEVDGVAIRSEVKADERYPAVSLASIMAKVTRDRFMEKLHTRFPNYGFNRHKGYGTKEHREAIRQQGILSCHRRSFLDFI